LPGRPDAADPRPIGDSLSSLARRLGVAEPSVLTGIFGKWEELVGPAIAAHATPLSLSQGVLVIGTDQPAWATQLRFLGPDLLVRLSGSAGHGQIERVEVKVIAPKEP
jgi:predicted nucleic acid-binding Zn ribbon protein